LNFERKGVKEDMSKMELSLKDAGDPAEMESCCRQSVETGLPG